MLERIWNVVLDVATVTSIVTITAIGVIAPLWAQVMIAGMLVVALTVRVLKRHSPTGMSVTAREVGARRLVTDDDLIDPTLMASFDAASGVFDAGNKSPGYAAAYAAARPIETNRVASITANEEL